MVDVDYSYRNKWYNEWYLQGKIPEDKVYTAFTGVSNMVNTVVSVISIFKSNSGDDDDGKGGSGLNGTVQDASQEEFEAKRQTKHLELEFKNAYQSCSNKSKPDKKLVDLAQKVLDDKETDGKIKVMACEIKANNESNKLSRLDLNSHLNSWQDNKRDGDAEKRKNPFGDDLA